MKCSIVSRLVRVELCFLCTKSSYDYIIMLLIMFCNIYMQYKL